MARGLREAEGGPAGRRGSSRVGPLPGAPLARDDSARHDALRSRRRRGPDGRVSPKQRPEADVNIEFQAHRKVAARAR